MIVLAKHCAGTDPEVGGCLELLDTGLQQPGTYPMGRWGPTQGSLLFRQLRSERERNMKNMIS